MRTGRVVLHRRLVRVAWFPLRGRRCSWIFERHPWQTPDRWHLSIGAGPAWVGIGPGTPSA